MTTVQDPQIEKLEKMLNLVGLSGAIFFLALSILIVAIVLISNINLII